MFITIELTLYGLFPDQNFFIKNNHLNKFIIPTGKNSYMAVSLTDVLNFLTISTYLLYLEFRDTNNSYFQIIYSSLVPFFN